jgi:hypothetical protein
MDAFALQLMSVSLKGSRCVASRDITFVIRTLDAIFLLREVLLQSENQNFLAPLAQLAEQVTLNHWVAGSIPARCSFD